MSAVHPVTGVEYPGDVTVDERGVYVLTLPGTATEEQTRTRWALHQLAAVSEGMCPNSPHPLEPYRRPDFTHVGRCRVHGWWGVRTRPQLELEWDRGRYRDGTEYVPWGAERVHPGEPAV